MISYKHTLGFLQTCWQVLGVGAFIYSWPVDCSHTGQWLLTLLIWHSRHSHGFSEHTHIYIYCIHSTLTVSGSGMIAESFYLRSKKKSVDQWICPAAGNDCLKTMQQKSVFEHHNNHSTCQLTQVPPTFPPEYHFLKQYNTQTLWILKFGKCWPIWCFSENKTKRFSRTSLESYQ